MFNCANLEVIRRQLRSQRLRQSADMVDASGVLIERVYLAPFAQQVDQIATVAASRIEYAHVGCNISAQNLVEDINVDLPELFLYAQRHNDTFSTNGF